MRTEKVAVTYGGHCTRAIQLIAPLCRLTERLDAAAANTQLLAPVQSMLPRPVWLIAIACLLLLAPAQAQRKQPKDPVGIAPPQPVQLNVKIRREGKTEIPLRIYGVANEPLQYLIRVPPLHGKLGEPRATGRETAVAVYEPPADLNIATDRFFYAVKSAQGVSAPVEVAVTILDQPAQLTIPDQLEFATVRTGNSSSKLLEITNTGGSLAVGEVIVEAPWRLEGKPGYRLAAGDFAIFKIFFAPTTGGRFEGVARFTSDPSHSTTLRGVGETSVIANPSELILQNTAGNPVRSGTLLLINQTEEPRELKLKANERLQLPAEVNLPGGSRVSVPVQTSAEDVRALNAEIEITAPDLELRVPVKAVPPGPVFRATQAKLGFGRVPAGKASALPVEMENIGGSPGDISWSVAAPFRTAQSSMILLPGEKRSFEVEIESAADGHFRAWLQCKAGEQAFDIALEADVTGGTTPGPARTGRRTGTMASATGAGREVPGPDEPSPNPETIVAEKLPPIFPPEWLADSPLPPGVQVLETTPTTATIQWPAAMSAASRFRLEVRVFDFDANRNLTVKWIVPEGFNVAKQGERYVATIPDLEPAQPWVVRVFPVPDGGGSADRLFTIEFRTTPKPSLIPRVSAVPGLLIVFVILIGWQVTLRWRRR